MSLSRSFPQFFRKRMRMAVSVRRHAIGARQRHHFGEEILIARVLHKHRSQGEAPKRAGLKPRA